MYATHRFEEISLQGGTGVPPIYVSSFKSRYTTTGVAASLCIVGRGQAPLRSNETCGFFVESIQLRKSENSPVVV
jgi:hypothetical protein